MPSHGVGAIHNNARLATVPIADMVSIRLGSMRFPKIPSAARPAVTPPQYAATATPATPVLIPRPSVSRL